ncbi:serine/threonine-protein kinase [Streptomyces coffeae]|uniref:Serine/threonine protein kinase n=1 Tax=Streptomyces coffeae TaxID=621382 RepID=A0ABS1NSR8_9ACTN|nr:serine/threonine-protein kinase [Streptomyces coffeae]MBL1102791.1 serine/threonine protein kinase [Streptomyces coffeae]
MDPLGADDPRAIGAYRLLGRLGSGGMGRVYLGRSAGGRTVAVKVVHAHFALDEEFRARFRREVEAARRVGGSWTAPVLDADPEAQVPWVATGYVAGPSLSRAISDEGPLPEASVRVLGAGLAEALGAVHALGLVHRDVKPSNVLLALDGPRLIDFGIARATDGTASLTSTGASIGSPGYMSPEQILGETVGGPTDVFSLGSVLAYAATGEGPFPGDSSAALLYKVVHAEPVLRTQLTGELRDLVAACLAKNPADRPTTEQIVRRLAPEGGASGLVRSGWLPGTLVERVSRQAVELLDLEAETEDPEPPASREEPPATPKPAAAQESAVQEFAGQKPAVREPAAEETSATGPDGPAPARPSNPPTAGSSALGTFGPPDPSYTGGPPGHGPADRPTPPPSYPVPASASPVPAPPAAAPEPGRGIALSASVGGRKRPKALSCTLVLSVAGALAVATTAAVVFDVLPGSDKKTSAGRDNADTPPGGGSSGSPSSPTESGNGPGAVPKKFLGTWRGDLTSDSGIPVGTMTITFRQGRVGEQVASGRVTLSVLRCDSTWKLVSADSGELRLDAELKRNAPQEGCSDGSTEERFTLVKGDALRYRAKDDQAGDPSGTLRRLR